MSARAARRRSIHMRRKGLMVVHSRGLSFDGEVPAPWLIWNQRRQAEFRAAA